MILLGEGDCDSDNDCSGNLECGSNNCRSLASSLGNNPDTFDSDDDCCTYPIANMNYEKLPVVNDASSMIAYVSANSFDYSFDL